MNYIELINNYWRKHEEHSIGMVATALYFHLLDVCNKQSWRNPFKRQNNRICGDIGITNPTLLRARDQLKLYGLIDFYCNGKGDSNVRYELLMEGYERNNESKNERNYHTLYHTSFPTSDYTSDDLNKTKKETKTTVVVACADAFNFFLGTRNYRLIGERYFGPERAQKMEEYFKIFYDLKVDLGELDNKPKEDLVRHFGMWLPIYLRAVKKEKSCAKKETAPTRAEAAQNRHNLLLNKFIHQS